MRKQKVLVLLLAGCLIIGMLGVIVHQQSRIVELSEVLPINEGKEWGATIYMRVYRSGVLLGEESHQNVITNAVRSALRGHIGDTALAVWDYIAIGTGTGGGAGSTALETEYSRYQGTYATVGSYNFTITFTWTAGNFSGQTITEYGLLNAAAAGTLFNYNDDFSRGPLGVDDSLQVTVNVQIGS